MEELLEISENLITGARLEFKRYVPLPRPIGKA
jgi:hypothetical protein